MSALPKATSSPVKDMIQDAVVGFIKKKNILNEWKTNGTYPWFRKTQNDQWRNSPFFQYFKTEKNIVPKIGFQYQIINNRKLYLRNLNLCGNYVKITNSC